MEAEQKAKELINMYYNYGAKSQLQAIEEAERAVLTGMCHKINDMDDEIVIAGDYDKSLVKPSIQVLSWWADVATELQNIKMKIPV